MSWICEVLIACHQSWLSKFLSLTLTLLCHINTLVCTILLPGNQMSLPTMLLLYQFWLTEICICCKPRPTNCTPNDPHASVFYTSSTLHTRHIRTIFELWGRTFCLSLLVSFFRCFYERNSIHTRIVFIFIAISTMFWPIRSLAFFRCLSNSGTYTELRTTSFIESMGVTCSDSVSHNQVQVLRIPVLLLTCSYDWTCYH